jgi:hypothetical protein
MPASVSDVRLAVTFRDHPKRRKLKRRLGSDGVLALIDLWSWAGANRPDGRLTSLDTEDIEAAAQWDGDEGALVAALVALRLLDETPEGYALHDWDEHQTWAAGAEVRAESARRAAEARWSKSAKSGTAPRIDPHSAPHDSAMPLSSPLLSSPSLSSPTPTESERAAPAQSSRAWGPARFREAWMRVTASTAPITDDIAQAGADACAKSAEALGCDPAERAQALIRAFVDLESCYREAGQKGLVGHAPPSRSAAAFVRGASGRWWGEAEQWCGGWRPRFAAAPVGAVRASPGAEVAPRHYDDAATTAKRIREWSQVRAPQGDDAAKIKDLLRSVTSAVRAP